MKQPKRATDINIVNSPERTERLISDGNDYYYRTRDGGLSTAFDTRADALYDLNNFILATSLEDELKSFKEETAA
jgi:hypothetical protein